MKKLIAILVMFVLMGCNGVQNTPNYDILMTSTVRVATAYYLEKNDSADFIIEANNFVQELNYTVDVYTYSFGSFKNKLLKELWQEELTVSEKETLLFLTDIIFVTVMEQIQAQDFYLVEPEALEMIQQLFNSSADVAKEFGVLE